MDQFNKDLGAVISAVVVTALVVGGAVYKTQKAKTDSLQSEMQMLNNKISELESWKSGNQGLDKKEDNQDDNQSQRELPIVPLEESGLKLDLCELPLEKGREDDWRYIDSEFNEVECYKKQDKILQMNQDNQEYNIDNNGFYYQTKQVFLDNNSEFPRSLKYTLEKGKVKDIEKLKGELDVYKQEKKNANYIEKNAKHKKSFEDIIKDNIGSMETVYELIGEEVVETPDRGINIINGKAAWYFDNKNQGGETDNSTVIYDGKDLRKVFNLDAIYNLGSIEKKIVFVGEKDGKNFIVYNGKKINFDFSEINLDFCCANAGPFWSGENFFFRARIGNKGYSVVISVK